MGGKRVDIEKLRRQSESSSCELKLHDSFGKYSRNLIDSPMLASSSESLLHLEMNETTRSCLSCCSKDLLAHSSASVMLLQRRHEELVVAGEL
jgi:hypothetical protein